MTFKISEKKLLTAIILFAVGVYLTLNNTVNFSSNLISEKILLFEVIGICFAVFGAVTFYKSFKKVQFLFRQFVTTNSKQFFYFFAIFGWTKNVLLQHLKNSEKNVAKMAQACNKRFGNMAGRRIYSQLFVRYWAVARADEYLFGFSSYHHLL